MTALGVEGISASSVSRITKELDEKVCEFLSNPIEREILYLFIDATYLKVRQGLHYENKALFKVAGVREDGLREILGVRLADSEDSLFCHLPAYVRIYIVKVLNSQKIFIGSQKFLIDPRKSH